MGQALPLPERIPIPDQTQRVSLEAMGFTFGNTPIEGYLPIAFPSGYHWHNNSWREDLPEWYILNSENLAVVCVEGSWKGSYDNKLELYVYDTPTVVKFNRTPPIPSQTSKEALIEKAIDAGLMNTELGQQILESAIEKK